jgi:Protein of unknown function (DUF3237)
MLTIDQIAAKLPGATTSAGLTPLFRGVWHMAPPIVLADTPAGTRLIADLTDGVIHGRGLTARIRGTATDWFVIGPNGIGTLDWRGEVVTDEGEVIYLHGTGRMDRRGETIYGSCLFETGTDRLRWLNKLQAVYRGEIVRQGATGAIYHDEYFELV